MYIRNRMTPNPYTIPSNTTIADAVALFRETGFKRFPVVDNGKLVGILTKGDIQSVSPTKATSLSIYEVNYFLSKITVKKAMTKKVIDCFFQEKDFTVISISHDTYLSEGVMIKTIQLDAL